MSAETADGKEVRFVSLRCQAVGKIVPLVECGVPVVDVHRFAFSSRESEDHHIREDLSGLATVTGPVEKRKRRSFRFPGAGGKSSAAFVLEIKCAAEKTEPCGDGGKPRLIPGLRKSAADGGDLLPRPGDGGGRNLPEGPVTQNARPAHITEPDAAGTERVPFRTAGKGGGKEERRRAEKQSVSRPFLHQSFQRPFAVRGSSRASATAAAWSRSRRSARVESRPTFGRLTNLFRGSIPRFGRGCCACHPR